MFYQESDIESYVFHENGTSGGKPLYSMFRGGGNKGKELYDKVIPVGLIMEQSASEECIRSSETGNRWVCKKEVGYLGNDAFEQLLGHVKHGDGHASSNKRSTRKQKRRIAVKYN